MSYLAVDVWEVLPYITILLFFGVPVYRYTRDPYGVHSPSTEVLEKTNQRWASMMFHYGLILVFLGHVAGLLVPPAVLAELGVTGEAHYVMAVYIGGASGIAMLAGLLWLTVRRFTNPYVRATSTWDYYVAHALLIAVVAAGLSNTLGYQIFVRPYSYESTVGAWLRGVLTLRPDAALMAAAPVTFQVHVFLAMLFLCVFPFTFLVHMWSGIFDVVRFLFRPRIVYRKRPVRG